jgi:hypothetical protein
MKSYLVSPSFLNLCCEANSCAKLSSDNKVKTAKKIIDFIGGFYVCTGSVSQLTYLQATLNECVPAGLYDGPEYDDESGTYQGLHFTCSHFMDTRWSEPVEFVFTGRTIIAKIVNPHEKNLYRAWR